MKPHEIQFRLHFCEWHQKTIHIAFGILKNQSDFAVWRRVQVEKKSEFSKRGSYGDKNSAAHVAPLALIQPLAPPDGSKGRGKKKLATNDPVAPRYRCWSETNLGRNCGPHRIWRCANIALRYEATPQPNRNPTIALRFVLCGFVCAFVWS